MAASHCHDTSVERRRAAAATVRRHLDELRSMLRADDLHVQIVDGSAVAVELYLAETNTICTAVRVAVFVGPEDRRAVERTMSRAGFEATTPSGDGSLLRLAGRRGRRAIHVLFEGAARTSSSADEPNPTSEAAARARAARLATAWLPAASTFRRVNHAVEPAHDVTESFEVQLIERSTRPRLDPRVNGSRR